MDLRSFSDQKPTKVQCLKLVDYVGGKKLIFKELLDIFLMGSDRVAQTIAWPLSIIVERHPELVKPYLGKVLSAATKPGAHDAVKRNVMRLLQFVDVPVRLRGKALELAFTFLQDRSQAVAIRVFSMTVILNLSENEPGLQRELQVLLEDEMPFGSAAFRSRASRVLRALTQQKQSKSRKKSVSE